MQDDALDSTDGERLTFAVQFQKQGVRWRLAAPAKSREEWFSPGE